MDRRDPTGIVLGALDEDAAAGVRSVSKCPVTADSKGAGRWFATRLHPSRNRHGGGGPEGQRDTR